MVSIYLTALRRTLVAASRLGKPRSRFLFLLPVSLFVVSSLAGYVEGRELRKTWVGINLQAVLVFLLLRDELL